VPGLTSLLILIHVQVPSLAPVRQIEATPLIEDEDDDEHEDEDPNFGNLGLMRVAGYGCPAFANQEI
jgi:hypothetical protein